MDEQKRKRKSGAGRLPNVPIVLWSKVDKGDPDECWEWLGYKNKEGYGRTWINDKGYYAHRVIYNLAFPGQIDLNAPKSTNEKGFVLHKCDNPSCCNPNHLYVGDYFDNGRDKAQRRRCPDFSGDKGPRCKLTMEQARQARELRAQGHSVRNLAIQFGISLPSMKSLLRGLSYKEGA
jgi:hypothetical protein